MINIHQNISLYLLFVRWAWLAFSTLLLFSQPVIAVESVEIPLGAGALKDPLVECWFPPKGCPDKVQFLRSGVSVRQYADKKGSPKGGAGIMLVASAKGDFKYQLDFQIKQLKPPVSGWGQGIMLRFMTDDPKMPLMVFGIIATKDIERGYRIEFPQAADKSLKKLDVPCSFSSGTWTIERIGGDISLKVVDTKGIVEDVATFPCTTASLNRIQIVCTRQNEGNADAEYVFKRIRLDSDEFFTFEQPQVTWWNWRTLFVTVLAANGCAFSVAFWLKRRNS